MRGLLLGARLAVSGGRTRLALTAAGVALGVALLLLAAAVPHMLGARRDRNAARTDFASAAAGPLAIADAETMFRETEIRGRLVRVVGAHAPVPPGLARVPGPGELVVSPALRALLSSPGGALLRPRLPGRVIGTIGHAGLQGPSELAFYRGVGDIPAPWRYITRFGSISPSPGLDPVLLLLAAVALAALLMPVAVFIATAARFGGEARDRRLAALRLVGADRATTVRVAAGESALGGLLGVAAGALLFFAVRPLASHLTLWDLSVFSEDIAPSPLLALLVVLAVPLTAIGATVLGLRNVVVEPLGVVRGSPRRVRRLAWRLAPVVLGLALLSRVHQGSEMLAAAAVVLLLAGVATLLPWLVEATVRRLDGGSVPWQLAIRRLQLDSGASARVVSGIAVAVAGAIALQTLFSGVEAERTKSTHADLAQAQAVAEGHGRPLGDTAARLAKVPGVRGALGFTSYDGAVTAAVGDCAVLRQLAAIGPCRDGDAFITGDPMRGFRATHVEQRLDPAGSMRGGLFLTPGHPLPAKAGEPGSTVFLRIAPGEDTIERVRNAAVAIDPAVSLFELQTTQTDHKFTVLRRAVLAGAAATLLLVGASLLVSLLEQVRDRRRLLAVLAAFGTRRATLGWSVLCQAAVPVALGLVLALVAGLGIGVVLLHIIRAEVTIDWIAVAALVGIGAGVVLAVTAASLPPLWRVMRTDGLRTE